MCKSCDNKVSEFQVQNTFTSPREIEAGEHQRYVAMLKHHTVILKVIRIVMLSLHLYTVQVTAFNTNSGYLYGQ